MTVPQTPAPAARDGASPAAAHVLAGGLLTPGRLCVQYGVSKGTMAWTLDVSRTCDKFWFGVTTDKDLDCNGWISDCDAAFMVSEEGEVRSVLHAVMCAVPLRVAVVFATCGRVVSYGRAPMLGTGLARGGERGLLGVACWSAQRCGFARHRRSGERAEHS